MPDPQSAQLPRLPGGLAARAVALAARYDADVIEASEPAQLDAALEGLRARHQQRIFVLAGDGTVQAIVQHLASLPAGSWMPELLLLGGGRSNAIARDFGGIPASEKLEAALRRCRDGQPFAIQERPLLRIEQQGALPQHGFLFVAAMIDCGVRLCRRHRSSGNGWLHKGPLSDAYCLTRLGMQVLLGRSPLPPYPQLQIDTDTGESLRGPSRVLIGTTLLHREGLYNPHAARGTGPVRITAVTAAASRFWGRLPRLLTGRFSKDMNLQHGYLSGSYERVEVGGLSGYSLDGEAFDTDPSRPVVLRGGMRLRVLQP